MFKIGFSKTDLASALSSDIPISDERIEAIAMYIEYSDRRALWIVFDFMDFNRLVTETLRQGIKKVTSLDESEIHIITTHNHGGGTPDIEILSDLAGQGAIMAINALEEATVKIAFTKCDRQINILRRLYIPEIEGVATLFFGASEKNNFDSSLFRENVIKNVAELKECNYIGESSNFEKAPFPSGDDEIIAIEFVNNQNETVGSIVRFAAHAVCSNRKGVYSSDYPYHVRKVMEQELGATCMFLNGPCGEIAPAIIDKYDGGERRIGEYIAKLAITALLNVEAESIRQFEDCKREIKLPVRDELVYDFVSISTSKPLTLADKRKHLESVRLGRMFDFLSDKYRSGEDYPSDMISVSLGLMMLNDLIIVAFPGETFYETANKIKEEFSDKVICTVTEHERTVMYMPPRYEIEKGGYESVCRVTDIDGESILRENAISHIRSFIK